jgi:hypothetical protein
MPCCRCGYNSMASCCCAPSPVCSCGTSSSSMPCCCRSRCSPSVACCCCSRCVSLTCWSPCGRYCCGGCEATPGGREPPPLPLLHRRLLFGRHARAACGALLTLASSSLMVGLSSLSKLEVFLAATALAAPVAGGQGRFFCTAFCCRNRPRHIHLTAWGSSWPSFIPHWPSSPLQGCLAGLQRHSRPRCSRNAARSPGWGTALATCPPAPAARGCPSLPTPCSAAEVMEWRIK